MWSIAYVTLRADMDKVLHRTTFSVALVPCVVHDVFEGLKVSTYLS